MQILYNDVSSTYAYDSWVKQQVVLFSLVRNVKVERILTNGGVKNLEYESKT